MTNYTITFAFVCFIFGIFRNAYSDQSKQVEDVVTAANVDQENSPNNLTGVSRRSSISLGHKPLPMAVQSSNNNQYTRNLVECYACTDCPKVLENTPKLCPYTPEVQRQGRCVVYVERYKQMKDPWYVRGCASERGTCSEIRKAYESVDKYVDLLSCSECEGDRCNGAPRSMVDMTITIITLAILPILGKCILA